MLPLSPVAHVHPCLCGLRPQDETLLARGCCLESRACPCTASCVTRSVTECLHPGARSEGPSSHTDLAGGVPCSAASTLTLHLSLAQAAPSPSSPSGLCPRRGRAATALSSSFLAQVPAPAPAAAHLLLVSGCSGSLGPGDPGLPGFILWADLTGAPFSPTPTALGPLSSILGDRQRAHLPMDGIQTPARVAVSPQTTRGRSNRAAHVRFSCSMRLVRSGGTPTPSAGSGRFGDVCRQGWCDD